MAERKRKRGRFSLKYKFILPLVAFTFLLSASFGAIAIKRLSTELESQLQYEGESLVSRLADKFADTSVPLLTLFRNLGFFLELLSGDVLFIQIKVGDLLYTHPRPELGELEIAPLELVIASGEARHRLPDGTEFLDVWEPLRERLAMTPEGIGPVRGYVRVGLSYARVRAEVRREIVNMALITVGYLIAGVLLAFIFHQMILGPVEKLIASVKRFRVDRRARARVRTGDELELLAEEFNKMADSIEERNRRLEEMNRELARANKVKSEFLAMMGHELKTPLHAIRGFSQLLLEEIDGKLNAKQREDVAAILKSGDHLLELIDNILRFSKLEAGEERLHLEEVDLKRLVDEVLQSFARFAEEKGLQLKSELGPRWVRADGTKLKQILLNLVGNAVKYAPQGKVEVHAEARDGQVLFTVTDTGPGVPADQRERIFEPFTQLDSSNTREATGIGLGLAIVKKYVEMHGGRVWVEDAPGGGSQFRFTIPQGDGVREAEARKEAKARAGTRTEGDDNAGADR